MVRGSMQESGGGKNLRNGIGALIREIRKAGGLTQAELSEKLGISYQQVQKYEYGTSELTISRLRQIAGVLGVPVRTFLPEDADGEGGALLFGTEDARAFALIRKLEARGLKPMAIRVLDAMVG